MSPDGNLLKDPWLLQSRIDAAEIRTIFKKEEFTGVLCADLFIEKAGGMASAVLRNAVIKINPPGRAYCC